MSAEIATFANVLDIPPAVLTEAGVMEHPSGVRFFYVPVDGASVSQVTVAFSAGFRVGTQESKAGTVVPHLLEHMVFKGSNRFTDTDHLLTAIGRVNGYLNGFTSEALCGFHVTCDAGTEAEAVEILGDVVFQPQLAQEHFDQEILVFKQEIEGEEDFPDHLAQECQKLLAPDLPCGLDEQIEQLEKLSLAEVKTFHKKYFVPANCMVACSGKVTAQTLKQIMAALDSICSGLTVGTATPLPSFATQPAPPRTVRRNEQLDGGVVVAISVLDQRSPELRDRAVLSVLCALAQSMHSSAILGRLRQDGITYLLPLEISVTPEASGLQVFLPTPEHDAVKVLATVLSGFADFANKDIPKEVFEAARGSLLNTLKEDSDSLSDLAINTLENYLLYGRLVTTQEYISAVENLTKCEVQNYAKDLLKHENVRSIAVGATSSNAAKITDLLLERYLGGVAAGSDKSIAEVVKSTPPVTTRLSGWLKWTLGGLLILDLLLSLVSAGAETDKGESTIYHLAFGGSDDKGVLAGACVMIILLALRATFFGSGIAASSYSLIFSLVVLGLFGIALIPDETNYSAPVLQSPFLWVHLHLWACVIALCLTAVISGFLTARYLRTK